MCGELRRFLFVVNESPLTALGAFEEEACGLTGQPDMLQCGWVVYVCVSCELETEITPLILRLSAFAAVTALFARSCHSCLTVFFNGQRYIKDRQEEKARCFGSCGCKPKQSELTLECRNVFLQQIVSALLALTLQLAQSGAALLVLRRSSV